MAAPLLRKNMKTSEAESDLTNEPATLAGQRRSSTMMAVEHSAETNTTQNSTISEEMKAKRDQRGMEEWDSDFLLGDEVVLVESIVQPRLGQEMEDLETMIKSQSDREEWDSDYDFGNEAALTKSAVQLPLGHHTKNLGIKDKNENCKEMWDSDYDLPNNLSLLSRPHPPLGQGMDDFDMLHKDEGKEEWDSDFILGNQALSTRSAFRVYLHGGKQLGEVDMVRKDHDGKEDWDSDFVFQDQEVRLHLRGGQGTEDVDTMEDCSSMDLSVEGVDALDFTFKKLTVYNDALTLPSSTTSGCSIQPSSPGFKVALQDKTANGNIALPSANANVKTVEEKTGSKGFGQSKTDLDLPPLKVSTVHPSEVKGIRPKSEGGEELKKLRMGGGDAVSISETDEEMDRT